MLELWSLLTWLSSNISASGMSHPVKIHSFWNKSKHIWLLFLFFLLVSLIYLHYLTVLDISESIFIGTDTWNSEILNAKKCCCFYPSVKKSSSFYNLFHFIWAKTWFFSKPEIFCTMFLCFMALFFF